MAKTVTVHHPALGSTQVPAKATHLYELSGWSTDPTPAPPKVSVTEDDDEIDFDID